LRKRRDAAFALMVGAVIIFTAAFTVYYVWRTSNPATLLGETIYISFDGRKQSVTAVYRFKNHLPLNAALPLEYSVGASPNVSDPFFEEVLFISGSRSYPEAFVMTSKDRITFELDIPPFDDGAAVVGYSRYISADSPALVVAPYRMWGVPRLMTKVYIGIPDDYEIADTEHHWEESGLPGFSHVLTLKPAEAERNIIIRLKKIG
jgi:hypothetical protein